MWFIFCNRFIVLLQNDLIKFMLNHSIVLLIYIKFLSSWGLLSTLLSRPAFIILVTEVSKNLTFICICTGPWMIQVSPSDDTFPFSALTSALTHIGISIWQDGFSSNFTAVTSTVGIFTIMCFVIGLCSTFINRFCFFHAFKHLQIFYWFHNKPLYTSLPVPDVRHAVQQKFIELCLTNVVTLFFPREDRQLLIKINHMISATSYF